MPAFLSWASATSSVELVRVAKRMPAWRSLSRLSRTSGCAGKCCIPSRMSLRCSSVRLAPWRVASISRAAIPMSPNFLYELVAVDTKADCRNCANQALRKELSPKIVTKCLSSAFKSNSVSLTSKTQTRRTRSYLPERSLSIESSLRFIGGPRIAAGPGFLHAIDGGE